MFLINIKSKNKKSIFIMINVFYLFLTRLNIIKKIFNKKNILIRFSILKSPHVHKSAQHSFGFKLYTKKIILTLLNFVNFILLFKLFLNKLFFDIKIKIVNYFYSINFFIKKFKFTKLSFIECSNLYNKKIKFKKRLKLIIKFLNIIIITSFIKKANNSVVRVLV